MRGGEWELFIPAGATRRHAGRAADDDAGNTTYCAAAAAAADLITLPAASFICISDDRRERKSGPGKIITITTS